MAVKTLNQVKAKLREIATAHAQVNSFYFGDITEWTEFEGLIYPSVFVMPVDAAMDGPLVRVNLSLIVSDLLLPGNVNRDDALSDTLQVLRDLLADIDLVQDWKTYGVQDATATFFEDYRGNDNADLVAGCRADIGLGLLMPKDACAIPRRPDRFIQTEGGLWILTEEGKNIEPE